MPYCIHCGNPVRPEDSFCISCGAKLNVVPPSPAPQDKWGKAHKARKNPAPAVPPEPVEGPEEMRKRVGSSSPRIDEAKVPDKQFLFVIWALRALFVYIVGMFLFAGDAMLANSVWQQIVMIAFVTVLSISGSEYFYWLMRSRMAGARLTPEGLDVQPIKMYGDLLRRKGYFINKDLIERVDIVRTRDAPPGTLKASPTEGVPSSLAVYLKGGKVRSFVRRSPEQLLAAREYAEAMWGAKATDEGDRKELLPEELYKTFFNVHNSNHFRSSALLFIGLTVMFGYLIVDMNLSRISTVNIVLSLVLGGLIAYVWSIGYLIYRQTYGVKEVRVTREGFELMFKNKSRFYDWSKVKALNMAKSDQINNKNERIASVSLVPRGSYLVSCDIGRALEQAYAENAGKPAPNGYNAIPKKGAYSTEEMNSLKYERPDLYRKNILVSVAFFVLGILLLINVALHIRLVTLVGLVAIVVLMFLRLQLSKEMKEHIRNGRSGGFPPVN